MVLRFVVPKADEAPIWNFSPTIPALSLHYPVKMEPVVGLALRSLIVPIFTNSKQFNRLRSFPSEIKVSAVVAKIKNYPASSSSKFSHSSASIILLELLLEVCRWSMSLLYRRALSPRSCRTIGPERSRFPYNIIIADMQMLFEVFPARS